MSKGEGERYGRLAGSQNIKSGPPEAIYIGTHEKPRTEKILLNVVCNSAKLAKVKAALKDLECSIKSETKLDLQGLKEWYTIEEVFPNHHAGHTIRGLRYREDMTQKQLAEAVGISVSNLSHMEHGRRPIGKEMAKRLAKVLNTDWRLLLS